MSVRVAIIGTAGRGGDGARMKECVRVGDPPDILFMEMCTVALALICDEWTLRPSDVTLVSGGAAYADHVAVKLFLDGEFAGLQLHLPCKFDTKTGRLVDNGRPDWKTNPGRSANRYHESFGRAVKHDTFADFLAAQRAGAELFDTYKGFHDRNKAVAKADYLVAFTWGKKDVPADGGTAHTWGLAVRAVRRHVGLHLLRDRIRAVRQGLH